MCRCVAEDDFALDFALLRVDSSSDFSAGSNSGGNASSMAAAQPFGVRAGEHLH